MSPGFLRTKLLEEPLEAQGSFTGEFWLSFEARQGRKATFDEVGDAVVMLSSPRMSLVVGVNLPIDGYVSLSSMLLVSVTHQLTILLYSGFTINENPA